MTPRCPVCGDDRLVLSDARGIRHFCDVCKVGWISPTSHPSLDDRRLEQDGSGHQPTGGD